MKVWELRVWLERMSQEVEEVNDFDICFDITGRDSFPLFGAEICDDRVRLF
jgi:hypothetical protein